MTADLAITPKQRQRLRPEYRALEATRRKRPAALQKEKEATKRRISTPEGWARYSFIRLKHKAKRFGMDLTIEWADLIPPAECPVFGCAFTFGGAARGWTASPTAPSVDRFDNDLGYVKGNVRIISTRANLLKKDGSLKEFEQLVAWLKREIVSSQR